MTAPWNYLLGRLSGGHSPSERVSNDAAPAAVEEQPAVPPLQSLGEKNELLHVRYSYMADRLEDLKSLSDDFLLLSKPIEELSTELPKAKSRVLELEALMTRETEERMRLQKELAQNSEKLSTLTNDYHLLFNRNKANEDDLDQVHAVAAADRTKLNELQKLLANADQQLAAERDNRQRLDAEVKDLSSLVSARTAEVQRLEDVTARQAERNNTVERELERLQGVVDKQVLERVDLQSRLNESDRMAQERLRELGELHQKLDAEQAGRQQRDHAHEMALSSLSAEKASLGLRLEALTSRIGSAEQAIGQARLQLAEKEAAIRASDNLMRETDKKREAAERQFAALEHRLHTRSVELDENQRLSEGLSKRCDMLTKALSAKEVALSVALEKARTRSERVDELTKEFELERTTLEAAYRRLVEELENERAERTLAQGALKIARESRASLQRLNESLKRANRAIQPMAVEEPRNTAPQSNVSFLPVGQKASTDDE